MYLYLAQEQRYKVNLSCNLEKCVTDQKANSHDMPLSRAPDHLPLLQDPCLVWVEFHIYKNSGYHLWNAWCVPDMVWNTLYPIFHWLQWNYQVYAINILYRTHSRPVELITLPWITHLSRYNPDQALSSKYNPNYNQGTVSLALNVTAASCS